TTTGHTVVMGYNNWKSIPAKLKNRTNIVISNCTVPDADQTISNLEKYITENENTTEEIFVIGGGMIYRELLLHAKHLYLTEIDATEPDADVFFPDFDKSKYHKTIIKKRSENGLDYSIAKYSKK
ncbi:dihydrofolate reductase, partial [Candidatus Saccharibacteria bacterium]|nr:dihydrofolate reductase [Candidatus Saccharibacteria bacterium]